MISTFFIEKTSSNEAVVVAAVVLVVVVMAVDVAMGGISRFSTMGFLGLRPRFLLVAVSPI